MRARFVLGKVAGAFGTLAFVLVINFFLFRVVNDDPTASMFRGRNMSPDQIQSRREQFNLTGGQFEQFIAFVRQTLRGNLGDSFLSNRPVTTEIREAIWPTVALVGTSTVLAMVIGIIVGCGHHWHKCRPWSLPSSASLVLVVVHINITIISMVCIDWLLLSTLMVVAVIVSIIGGGCHCCRPSSSLS